MLKRRTHRHQSFRQRVKRVDPVYYRWGERGNAKDATAHRPTGAILLGFAWAYLVISISNGRDTLQASLAQGSLSQETQDVIFMGLAGLLAASLVMLAVHLFRFFMKSGAKRGNSGALLVGVMGALVLVYTPASVWNTSFNMLDGNSQSMLLTASASVTDSLPGIDFGSTSFVSSIGK